MPCYMRSQPKTSKHMNWIDIVIILPLLWALYSGWRNGIIIQVGVIAGLVVGIALTYFLGSSLLEWMNVTNPVGVAITYVAIAGTALILVVIVARTISGAFNAAGLGIVDQLGGALLSLLKVGLIVSVALCCFQWLNNKKEIVAEKTLDNSMLYRPMVKLTSYAFPFMELAKDKIDQWHRQDDKRVDEQQIEEARDRFPNNG